MNESQPPKTFLESTIYKDPKAALQEVADRLLGSLDGELKGQLEAYLQQAVSYANPKDPTHQTALKPILEGLLSQGKKEEAGLIFNIHRILTEFAGYGSSERASSDVDSCFDEKLEIPRTGVIVVDFFATRNLPKIVQMCEARKIDLGRIKVCVPKGILAAQLVKMSVEKREEFEAACAKLSEDQFVIDDANHNGDIKVDGPVAIWFSPRTMPIYPRLHAETEAETIENYRTEFGDRARQVVEGGRIYANLAYSEEFTPLAVEVTKGKRDLTKLNGMSKNVAVAVMKLLLDELGFETLGRGEFDPAGVDPNIDHAKLATELHVRKRAI